jgi:enamine deaminase RidA (YjgF/YER057c/UK114 family)
MRVMERTAINPWDWSLQFGFNQAELVTSPSKVLVCSGQTAIDGDGNVQHAGDIAGQIAMAVGNLAAVLRDAGMTLDDVVRITAFTTDMDGFLAAIGALGERKPSAFTLIGVTRLAYPELLVELEAIAVT